MLSNFQVNFMGINGTKICSWKICYPFFQESNDFFFFAFFFLFVFGLTRVIQPFSVSKNVITKTKIFIWPLNGETVK